MIIMQVHFLTKAKKYSAKTNKSISTFTIKITKKGIYAPKIKLQVIQSQSDSKITK